MFCGFFVFVPKKYNIDLYIYIYKYILYIESIVRYKIAQIKDSYYYINKILNTTHTKREANKFCILKPHKKQTNKQAFFAL